MGNGPEEQDVDAIALLKNLESEPERNPQVAARAKAKFLAEAISERASVSAAREVRHSRWKEDVMHLARIPVYLIAIAGVAVLVVSVLMIGGPVVGNTFSTINSSLSSVGGPSGAPTAQHGPGLTNPQPSGRPAIATEAAIPEPTAGAPIPPGTGYTEQMVIKNADLRLLVKDTDRALDGMLQAASDVQGYLISSRVWSQDYHGTNYKYATVTIGVPADQFENALRRLRSLAVRVLDESASGQDVTDQYVDLESQVTNLEATRERIKGFLDQTQTVDESLRINYQLSLVEAQIEQLKGQMKYLSGRAGFSTITINLEPELPEILPTVTPNVVPTVMPTATPLAALQPWDVSGTTRQATNTLVSLYRLLAEFLIWVFLVVIPVLGPPAILIWLVTWLIQRRKRPAPKGQGA